LSSMLPFVTLVSESKPRFIGPFKIMEKRGELAYQLELPPQLSDVHDVFHVS
jgi:hypothetical protein